LSDVIWIGRIDGDGSAVLLPIDVGNEGGICVGRRGLLIPICMCVAHADWYCRLVFPWFEVERDDARLPEGLMVIDDLSALVSPLTSPGPFDMNGCICSYTCKRR